MVGVRRMETKKVARATKEKAKAKEIKIKRQRMQVPVVVQAKITSLLATPSQTKLRMKAANLQNPVQLYQVILAKATAKEVERARKKRETAKARAMEV